VVLYPGVVALVDRRAGCCDLRWRRVIYHGPDTTSSIVRVRAVSYRSVATRIGSAATLGPFVHRTIGALQVCPLPSLRRKEITWPVKKRHPKRELRQHVLIAEQKWSLSISHQLCSSVNSRNSRSHVRSAVLRKYSSSNAADDPSAHAALGKDVASQA
jgi:hypothetical protein